MTVKGPSSVVVTLVGLATLLCGILFLRQFDDWGREFPRLVATGSGHESGQGMVAFRVVVPETRRFGGRDASNPVVVDDLGRSLSEVPKAAGFVFSRPQVVDSAGQVQDVTLIRYVTPANEPSIGTVQSVDGTYRLRLDVAFEERGVAGWIRRVRNCWISRTLRPLGDIAFGDPVTISSDWITNSVVRRSGSQQ